jgi:hypothetical protein
MYYNRNEKARRGMLTGQRAPLIWSEEIQNGRSTSSSAEDATEKALQNPGAPRERVVVASSAEGTERGSSTKRGERAAQWARVMRREKREEC